MCPTIIYKVVNIILPADTQRFRQFTPPPLPNNDIIEIGMEDSAIQIHSGRVDEVRSVFIVVEI